MTQYALVFLGASTVFFLGCLVYAAWIKRQQRILREYEAESITAASESYETSLATSTKPTKSRVPFLSLITRNCLITDNEIEFFRRLVAALPEHHVFVQVALSALIKPVNSISESERLSVFRKFSQKRADFVICARDTLRVAAIIELDDKSHCTESDKRRDGMLRAGGYEVIRYQSDAKPSSNEIAQRLSSLMRKA